MSAANINPKKVALLKQIRSLIDCLVNIKDETGEFLMTLEDGRVIDTKGWNDWEVSPYSRSEQIPSLTPHYTVVDPRSRTVRPPQVPRDHRR